jgi:hypothetical protein
LDRDIAPLFFLRFSLSGDPSSAATSAAVPGFRVESSDEFVAVEDFEDLEDHSRFPARDPRDFDAFGSAAGGSDSAVAISSSRRRRAAFLSIVFLGDFGAVFVVFFAVASFDLGIFFFSLLFVD